MARILIIADLHLDHWLQTGRDPLPAILAGEPDILIVAGDLSNKPKTRWPYLLQRLAEHIPPENIYILPGNHDYYDHVLDGDSRLAEICADIGVHFVQKKALIFGRTRFLCCTLWTDFSLRRGQSAIDMLQAQRMMNDYRYIRQQSTGYRRIRPSDTALVHSEHRAWLSDQLETPYAGDTVIVTHHCPHPELVGNDSLAAAYGSDLRDMIGRYRPKAWYFGHTHFPAIIHEGGTCVQNVSLGYPDEIAKDQIAGIGAILESDSQD